MKKLLDNIKINVILNIGRTLYSSEIESGIFKMGNL